jgi:Tol biopolymer transport system component
VLFVLLAGCGGGSEPSGDVLVFGIAPDYDEIAYDIRVVRPDGGGLRSLTNDVGYYAHNPVASPDGRQIAFDATESTPPESSLHVMAADGTHKRRLVPKKDGFSYALDWSPDSKLVLYVLVGAGIEHVERGLWAVGIDGSGKRRLVPRGREATWSPDGSTIAFVTDQAIHLFDVRERRSRLLVRGADSPRWTPDGRRILFRKVFQGKRSGIYVVDAGGGAPRLIERLGPEEDPFLGDVSPDGEWVLVGYHPAISRISLDDGELQKLTSGRSDWAPVWSPDGTQIAFERNGDIWLMDADGESEGLVARSRGFDVYARPHWLHGS